MSNRFVITQKNLAEMKIGIMICFSKLYDIPMDEVVDLFQSNDVLYMFYYMLHIPQNLLYLF